MPTMTSSINRTRDLAFEVYRQALSLATDEIEVTGEDAVRIALAVEMAFRIAMSGAKLDEIDEKDRDVLVRLTDPETYAVA